MVHCARCHGDDAVGGLMAPDLRFSMARGAVAAEAFDRVVIEGRREKGMPGFKGVLSDDQVALIRVYVAERASGRLKAGRPA
jgi:cytochrome c